MNPKPKNTFREYLPITGKLIAIMQNTGNNVATHAGYTLTMKKVNGMPVYTLTNEQGRVLDSWNGLHDSKFETR